MFDQSIQTIEQFKEVLKKLPLDCYSKSCTILSNATIGQHTRHIVELYQCLLNGYESAEVCYDKRERNRRIEEKVDFAIDQLGEIQLRLQHPNKALQITHKLGNSEACIQSNYFREVLYNLEHTIHHHALIKVGIQQLTNMELPESFGVAPSTIQYRKECVQ